MKNKKERLKALNEEEFYFIFFDGTLMPNNKHYINITMFKDTFYIADEKEEKENYKDMFFIIKVKKMIENNLENIEKMQAEKGPAVKSSFNHKFDLKINNKIYSVNRNVCNDEGKKLFDEFKSELYEILNLRKSSDNNNIVDEINNWKKNRNVESFKKMIERIRKHVFYSPIKETNGKKEISIIKNSKNERLLTAFSSMVELKKWIKDENTNINQLNFKQFSAILLTEEYKIDAIVIDPFGVNLVLDKKIVKDILQLK